MNRKRRTFRRKINIKDFFNVEFISIAFLLMGGLLLSKPVFTGMTVLEGNVVENGSLFSLVLVVGGIVLFLMHKHEMIPE